MIKRFEGLRTKAYCDDAGVWTIGYGHTGCVGDGDIITEAAADKLLEADVELFASRIDLQAQRDGITLSQGEFDALTDFAFNLGLGALFNSTLWKMLKEIDILPSLKRGDSYRSLGRSSAGSSC